METKAIIDHTIIKDAIENSWFETDPKVSDDEITTMAISVAGEVDEFIRGRDVKKLELEKTEKNENLIQEEKADKIAKMKQKRMEHERDMEMLRHKHATEELELMGKYKITHFKRR